MKKIISLILCGIIAVGMTACGNEISSSLKEPDVSEIGASVSADCPDIDTVIDADKMEIYFTGLDMNAVESFYAKKAQAAFTDHLVIVKVKDKSSVSAVSDVFEAYKVSLRDTYESYAPAEADRAINGTVRTFGDKYVVLIISEDNDAIESKIAEFFK